MVGKGGKHDNLKTLISADFSTICPRLEEGRPCSYCYVQTPRDNGGFRAKTSVDYEPYDGFVLRLKQSTILRLNAGGGMRLFSFADYKPAHNDDIQALLDDAKEVGLWVKVITKQRIFLPRFHDHEAVKVVQVSVDSMPLRIRKDGTQCQGSDISIVDAFALRDQYEKVLIRAAVMDRADLEFFAPQVDILTLNHSPNGFHKFNHHELNAIRKQYPRQTCCATGKCETCPIRCGVMKTGELYKPELDLSTSPHSLAVTPCSSVLA